MRHIVVVRVGKGGEIEACNGEVIVIVIDERERAQARDIVHGEVDFQRREVSVLYSVGRLGDRRFREDPASRLQHANIHVELVED